MAEFKTIINFTNDTQKVIGGKNHVPNGETISLNSKVESVTIQITIKKAFDASEARFVLGGDDIYNFLTTVVDSYNNKK